LNLMQMLLFGPRKVPFKSRKVFDKSREPLENLVTGLEADPSVNIYLAKEVGNSIINNIIGQSVKTFSFKRKNQAITMGTKIKRKDGTILQINAQNLFDRLISMALVCAAEDDTCDLYEILSYELAPFPPSLFENDVLMLEANKPQLTDLLKTYYTPQ
jgi:hypothetical protein